MTTEDDLVDLFNRLREVETWKAEIGAECALRWEQQGETNKVVATIIDDHAKRLTAAEKRIIWISGVAAGAGALLGSGAVRLFGGG